MTHRQLSEIIYLSVHRGHVEAQANTVELFAQVAHGLQGAVTAHGGDSLEDFQQVLALEGEANPWVVRVT